MLFDGLHTIGKGLKEQNSKCRNKTIALLTIDSTAHLPEPNFEGNETKVLSYLFVFQIMPRPGTHLIQPQHHILWTYRITRKVSFA